VAGDNDHPNQIRIVNIQSHAIASLGPGNSRMNLDNPDFVSIAPNGSIYFVSLDGDVHRFAAGAEGDVLPLSTRHLKPLFHGSDLLINHLVADNLGNLYLSRADRDAIETISLSGETRTLEGAHTGLAGPNGMTVDSRGNLYVTNTRNNSVTVYSLGAHGNARPFRVIAGDKTGLQQPQAIANDRNGTLYIFYGPPERNSSTYPEQYVAAFALNANGNEAPLRRSLVRAGCFTNDHI